MKHRVSELEGVRLATAVAMASGFEVIGPSGSWVLVRCEPGGEIERFAPDRRWEHGGPIIERERIALQYEDPIGGVEVWGTGWRARVEHAPVAKPHHSMQYRDGFGPTPLIAAMRAYVASKFGEEVELPEHG